MKTVIALITLLLGTSIGERLVWAACDPAVKAQLTADVQQKGDCIAGEEHCRVGKLLSLSIDKGLYGTSTGYVQTFKQCMKEGVDGCVLPPNKAIDPSHSFILITLGTDASYVAAGGKPDFQTASGVYQCVNELLGEILTPQNVIETDRVAIALPQGQAGGDNGNAPADVKVTGLDCKSSIFDCSKPLAFFQLPIGQFCAANRVDLGKQKQMILVNGTEAMVVLDLRTMKAVACKNQAQAKACSGNDDIVTVGKNADGSNHMAIIDGNVLVNPAGTFQKMMMPAKSLLEIASQPVASLCDDVLKEAKGEFEKNAFKIPGTEVVMHNGKLEAVEVAQGALRGNKAYLVLKSKASNTLIGVGVLTIGDTPESTKMVFKPFSNDLAVYKAIKDVALTNGDPSKVRMTLSLDSDAIECEVSSDETQPLVCDAQKKISGINEGMDKLAKVMIAAKFKQQATEEVGSEEFGGKLVDAIANQPNADPKKFPSALMHGFEEFGLVPNALVMDASGNRIYRRDATGNVALDPNEILPGTSHGCLLTDIDSYGGKDLICFAGNTIYFVPKLNLPPRIDQLTLVPADGQKVKGQAVTRTQEDEDLVYSWKVFEYKDGKLTERADLLANAATAAPTLNFPVDSVATSVSSLAISANSTLGVAKADIGVNASLAKSVGMKSAESSQPVYFVALTATDPGGMSATSYAAISKGVSAAAGPTGATAGSAQPALPLDATTVGDRADLGGPNLQMEGGFSCSVTRSGLTPMSLVALLLLLVPILVAVPARAKARVRRK
jgi:hypothetical protein